jgi:hypothetical protein
VLETTLEDGKNKNESLCEYDCPAEQLGATFPLPTTVAFSVGKQNDAWQERLTHVGQVLSSYADRETRQFVVDFDSSWNGRAERAGDRIDYVELRSPRGLVYRFVHSPNQRMTIPGATCDDPLTYRVVGQRDFEEGSAAITQGRVSIGDPDVHARVVTWGAHIGGGFTFPVDTMANIEPHAVLGVDLRVHPKWPAPWVFEGNVVYMVGPGWYQPLETPDNANQNEVATAVYNRAFVSAMPVLLVGDLFEAGFSPLAVGFGWPVRNVDHARLPTFQATWNLHGLLRLRVARKFAFEINVRYSPREVVLVHSGDFLGTPSHDDRAISLFLLDLGMHLWL